MGEKLEKETGLLSKISPKNKKYYGIISQTLKKVEEMQKILKTGIEAQKAAPRKR